MAGQNKTSKKPRKHKVSMGKHGGGGKVKLTELQKAQLGGGVHARFGSGKDTKAGQRAIEASRNRKSVRRQSKLAEDLSQRYNDKRSSKVKVGRFPKNG